MGGEREGEPTPRGNQSVCDALLFATMCIVGLPVEVEVKDGSVYSGIFHTASIDQNYGIVLKKARKIGRGKTSTDIASEVLVETLVVHSGDLVQVLAKGVLFPKEGIIGDIRTTDTKDVCGANDYQSRDCVLQEDIKAMNSINASCVRQHGQHGKQGEESSDTHMDEGDEADISITTVDINLSHGDLVNEMQKLDVSRNISDTRISISAVVDTRQGTTHTGNSTLACLASSDINTFPSSVLDVSESLSWSPDIPPSDIHLITAKDSENNTNSKAFKLNPDARAFLPSHRGPVVIPSAAFAIGNAHCVSSANKEIRNGTANISFVPSVGAQLPVGISNKPPFNTSVKFIQQSNMANPNYKNTQYLKPAIGHLSMRQPPSRFIAPFHPLQVGASYPPDGHTAAVGRQGQVVYVPLLSQDIAQGSKSLPQLTPLHLPTVYQANLPKFPGNETQQFQIFSNPQLVAGIQHPFSGSNTVPFPHSHPVQLVQTVPIPSPAGHHISSCKFY